MEHSKETQIFRISCGINNSTDFAACVTNGVVSKISLNSFYNEITCTPDDSDFEYELQSFIEMIYKKSNKNYYEDFVNSLNSETLEKYFKPFYVPK